MRASMGRLTFVSGPSAIPHPRTRRGHPPATSAFRLRVSKVPTIESKPQSSAHAAMRVFRGVVPVVWGEWRLVAGWVGEFGSGVVVLLSGEWGGADAAHWHGLVVLIGRC